MLRHSVAHCLFNFRCVLIGGTQRRALPIGEVEYRFLIKQKRIEWQVRIKNLLFVPRNPIVSGGLMGREMILKNKLSIKYLHADDCHVKITLDLDIYVGYFFPFFYY